MITKEQQDLINYLCRVGYGWGAFADSVKKQGWCSEKQYQTMLHMKQKIQTQRERIEYWRISNKWIKQSKRRAYPEYDLGGVGCSDSEAMSLGEYF